MNFKNAGMDGRDGQQPLALARQSSVYSLTFDEFQSTMGSVGKDFGSMNMDELLRNIWTAEESQAMAATLGGGIAGTSGAADGLQRQGSLTLPRTLSQKTVDEVWRDLIGAGQGLVGNGGESMQQQRQPTLGEMTLEEFLARAGVVREEIPPSRPAANAVGSVAGGNVFFGDLSSSGVGFPQAGKSSPGFVGGQINCDSGSNLGMKVGGVRPFAAPMGMGMGMGMGNGVDIGNGQVIRGVDIGNGQGIRREIVGMGDGGMSNSSLMQGVVGLGGAAVPVATVSPMSDGLGKTTGDLSSVSPVPYVFNTGLRGRKAGAVEKVMERRQRRMIKNRESAARSRARKQAYTMELEAEVAKLKEQNQELKKKQAEMMEIQKNQVLEIINQQQGPKKRCLRRTQTGPW